jgi:hypothetical protein
MTRRCRYHHVMPADRTVLDHLIEGREALLREIQRLTTAKEELDAVIGRLGVGDAASASGRGTVTTRSALSDGTMAASSPTGRKRTRGAAKKAARRSAPRSAGDGSKSIRVHVLEMLATEDRDFGLTEIIGRIHGAGIQAHDDAVRSITIKLMKDGTVERVGRGQYRLARREASPAATASISDETPVGPPSAEASLTETTDASASTPPPLNLAQPWTARP